VAAAVEPVIASVLQDLQSWGIRCLAREAKKEC